MATSKTAGGKTVTILQVHSPQRRPREQRATLIGLGLNKLHKRSTLADTAEIRGMIRRVQHLVRIVES